MIRGLYAFGRGGVLGTGLGAGLPQVGSIPAIPAIHTDFVFAALGEELGLVGALAICALYLLIAARGFHIALVSTHIRRRENSACSAVWQPWPKYPVTLWSV